MKGCGLVNQKGFRVINAVWYYLRIFSCSDSDCANYEGQSSRMFFESLLAVSLALVEVFSLLVLRIFYIALSLYKCYESVIIALRF